MKKIETKITVNNTRILIFDSNIYSLNIIKKAMYRFMDICIFKFETQDSKILVTAQFISNYTESFMQETIQQIHNEVLDQDLRHIIAKETENVKNLILANAFSNTKLINCGEE